MPDEFEVILMYLLQKIMHSSWLISLYRIWNLRDSFFRIRVLLMIKQLVWYTSTLLKFSKKKNGNFSILELDPQLLDNLEYTPVDPVYFFQDCWAAKKIFDLRPEKHYDVGSSIKTIGIISQIIPTLMVDIRPIDLKIDNLEFKKGSILELPFEDESIESLSCLCVIEHIGLGRYGDEVNPFGSEMAAKEINRIMKCGGIVFISAPVSDKNKILFNAHRVFTRNFFLSLFSEFEVVEERYQYGRATFDNYNPEKGNGTGLYMLRKRM